MAKEVSIYFESVASAAQKEPEATHYRIKLTSIAFNDATPEEATATAIYVHGGKEHSIPLKLKLNNITHQQLVCKYYGVWVDVPENQILVIKEASDTPPARPSGCSDLKKR